MSRGPGGGGGNGAKPENTKLETKLKVLKLESFFIKNKKNLRKNLFYLNFFIIPKS